MKGNGMFMTDIMIIVATVLAVMFPWHLIKAVRAKDENSAGENAIKASAIFGVIVFIALVVAR